MEKELISIVVPIYNVEKYLDRCIESLVNQTYKNIEIILVNDGSTDSSGELAELWKKKDNRIIVLNKSNGGLSDARNYGMKVAKGIYLSFVDSDDYVDEKFIDVLYSTAFNSKAKVACVGFQYFNDNKMPIPHDKNENVVEVFETEEALSFLYTNEKYANYAWNKLYLRELFNDIEYPVGRKMEDLGTTYLIFDKCSKVVYNPATLYYYYQREDSILHSSDDQFWTDKFALVCQRYTYVKEKYPNLLNNYLNFVYEVLGEYPYISKMERINSLYEVKQIWSRVRGKCPIKTKVKYFLLKIFPNVYIKVFRK